MDAKAGTDERIIAEMLEFMGQSRSGSQVAARHIALAIAANQPHSALTILKWAIRGAQ
jgi:hypothetical protein